MDRSALKQITSVRVAEVMQFMGYADVASFVEALRIGRGLAYKWLAGTSAPTMRSLRKHLGYAKEANKRIRDVEALARYVRGSHHRPAWFRLDETPPPGQPVEREPEHGGAEIIEIEPSPGIARVSASAVTPPAMPLPLIARLRPVVRAIGMRHLQNENGQPEYVRLAADFEDWLRTLPAEIRDQLGGGDRSGDASLSNLLKSPRAALHASQIHHATRLLRNRITA